MKKKTRRKMLGFLLTLAMVFSTFTGIVPGMSMTVFAAETTIRCEGTRGSINTMFPQNGIDRHRNSFGDTDSQLVNSSSRFGDVYFIAPEGKCFTKIVVVESNNDPGADCWTGWQGRAINVSQTKRILPSTNDKIIIDFTVDDLAIYNVKLNTNGGTVNDGNISTYAEFYGATLPTDVTRNGYTFEGWYDNADLSGEPVTSIASDATGDKEYWAKWTQIPIAKVTSAPTGKKLTYNEKPQELITAGKAENGIMEYALGTKKEISEEFSETIPTATKPGTYYIWYVAAGDEDHNDSEYAYVTATITEGDSADGPIETAVNVSEGTPEVQVEGLDNDLVESFLTEEEKKEHEAGAPVRAFLNVKSVDKENVPAGDLAAAEKIISANGYTYGTCLDITMWKQVGNAEAKPVHEMKKSITLTVTLPVPGNFIPTKAVHLLQVHNGVATDLGGKIGSYATWKMSTFSSYFIVFEDVKDAAVETAKTETPAKNSSVATGDSTHAGFMLAMMLGCAATGVYLTLRKRERR